MNRQALFLLVSLLACLMGSGVVRADDKLTSYQDELPRGNARFRLTTACLADSPDGARHCVTQSLWLTSDASGRSVPVSIGPRLSRRPLVRGSRILYDQIYEWACVASDSGWHYLFLLYSCDDFAPNCPAAWAGEWNEIVDMRGRWVTGRRNGMSGAVLQRLGLEKALRVVTGDRVGPFR